jgi:hypothetical protein
MSQRSQQELLDSLKQVCWSHLPTISAVRNAIKGGTVSKSELEMLMRNLKSQEMDVLTHLLGLKGETAKTIKQITALIPGIRESIVPDLAQHGLYTLTLCLESVDPTYNPYATAPIPSNPTPNQLAAQIELMGHGNPSIGEISTLCMYRKFNIDVICEDTRKKWLDFLRNEKALDLLERILAVFGRKLISANLAFLLQRLAQLTPSLLMLIPDALIQRASLEKLRSVPHDRWNEINQLGSKILQQSEQHSSESSQELIDRLVQQSSCLIRILLEAYETPLTQNEVSATT